MTKPIALPIISMIGHWHDSEFVMFIVISNLCEKILTLYQTKQILINDHRFLDGLRCGKMALFNAITTIREMYQFIDDIDCQFIELAIAVIGRAKLNLIISTISSWQTATVLKKLEVKSNIHMPSS